MEALNLMLKPTRQTKQKEGEDQPLPEHIREYVNVNPDSKEVQVGKELFKGDKDIELRTDLSDDKLCLINSSKFNDILLKEHHLSEIYAPFTTDFMKLRVSKDRKSRTEFVDLNRNQNQADIIDTASKINNLASPKR